MKDWIYNSMILKNKEGIHKGFYEYTNECIKTYDLISKIKTHKNVTLSGYSLGAAAVVILLYVYLFHTTETLFDEQIIKINLFGCPRIGNKLFNERLHEMLNTRTDKLKIYIMNFKNSDDIVCDIPPKFMGYSKTFNHIVLKSNDKTTCCKITKQINDHDLNNYHSNLSSLLEQNSG